MYEKVDTTNLINILHVTCRRDGFAILFPFLRINIPRVKLSE